MDQTQKNVLVWKVGIMNALGLIAGQAQSGLNNSSRFAHQRFEQIKSVAINARENLEALDPNHIVDTKTLWDLDAEKLLRRAQAELFEGTRLYEDIDAFLGVQS